MMVSGLCVYKNLALHLDWELVLKSKLKNCLKNATANNVSLT